SALIHPSPTWGEGPGERAELADQLRVRAWLKTRALSLTLSPGGRGNISLVLFIDSSIQAGVSPETHSPLPAGLRCQTGPQTVPAPPVGLGPGGCYGRLGSGSYKR